MSAIESALIFRRGGVVGHNVLCVWRGVALGKPNRPLMFVEGDAKDKKSLPEADIRELSELKDSTHKYEGILIHGGQTLNDLEKEITKQELKDLKLPIALATAKPDPEFDDQNLERLPAFAVLVHARDGTKEQYLGDPRAFVRKHWGLSSKDGPDERKVEASRIQGSNVLCVCRGEAVDKPEEEIVCFEGDAKDKSLLPVAKVGIMKIYRTKGKKNHDYEGILIHGGRTMDIIEKRFSTDDLTELNLPIALATPKEDPKWDPVNLERLPPGSVIVHQADGTKAQFLQDPKKFAREHGDWIDLDEEPRKKSRRAK